MNYKQIADEINTDFSKRADAALHAKYSRYFKGGFPGYGLPEGITDAALERLAEEHKPNLQEALDLGDQLFATGKYECGSLAIKLLSRYKKEFDRGTFVHLKHWFDDYVSNWAHNDYLCSEITPVFFQRKLITLSDFDVWRISPATYTRRAVPVTMLCLRKTEDPLILLDYLEPMMGEAVREVHQGLGWFLRELWKLHPEPVEDFLLCHKQHGARLIYQYACEKMDKEYKERFRREKKQG